MFFYTYAYWLTDVLMLFKIADEFTHQYTIIEERFNHHVLKSVNLEGMS